MQTRQLSTVAWRAITEAFGRFVASPQADLVAVMLVIYAGIVIFVSAYEILASPVGAA